MKVKILVISILVLLLVVGTLGAIYIRSDMYTEAKLTALQKNEEPYMVTTTNIVNGKKIQTTLDMKTGKIETKVLGKSGKIKKGK